MASQSQQSGALFQASTSIQKNTVPEVYLHWWKNGWNYMWVLNGYEPSTSQKDLNIWNKSSTIFHRINTLGAETEIEALFLSDLDEIPSGTSSLQQKVLKIWLRSVHSFLRYGQVKSKVRGAFIQAGAFIRPNTVYTFHLYLQVC